MLQRIFTVAFSTYRESVRARILVGLAGVALAVAGYSLTVAAYTLHDAPRVIADLGTAAMSIFAIMVAVVIGATSLYRELEMKTILPLLARPIRRSEYLVGKYLGTMLVVGVFVVAEAGLVLLMTGGIAGDTLPMVLAALAAMIVALVVASAYSPWARDFGAIPLAVAMLLAGFALCTEAPLERTLVSASALLTILEVAIVASFATFFSSFSSPFLTSLFTLALFIIGRSADSLARLPAKFFGPAISEVGKGAAQVFPNLHVYVPARPLLTGEAATANLQAYLFDATLQSLAWTVAVMAIAAVIFQRRDFL